jgi:ferredoxin-like protein FixX
MADQPVITKLNEVERFKASIRVDADTGCHIWTGALNTKGYGRFGGGEMAHRAALRLAGIAVPTGFEVDHLCRQRCCVNPQHLDVVTHRENIARAAALIVACPAGHPYSGSNLSVRNGKRVCRECGRLRATAKYQPKSPRRRRRHLLPDEVARVRELIASGTSHSRIGEMMCLSAAAVSNIRTGKSHGR